MSFNDILMEHAKWKVQLRTAIELGVAPMASDQLLDSKAWPLSQWLSNHEEQLGHLKVFRDFQRDYEAFHLCVADVLMCLEQGEKEKARSLARSEMFTLISYATVDGMTRLQRYIK